MAKATTKKRKTKAAKPTVKNRKVKVSFLTPVGQFVYPYLTQPDEGREYSDGKYKVSLMWTEQQWEKIKGPFEAAIKECAAQACGVEKIRLDQIANPIKLGNDRENPGVYEDMVYVTAKTGFEPKVFGPSVAAGKWSKDEIATIKSGDHGRIEVVIYPYTQSGGGVTLGLQSVQFSHSGDAIAGGQSLLTDLEVELEDPEDEEDDEEYEGEEADAEEDDDEEDLDDFE